MKRGLAIPCGLLLFGLAVASGLKSRPAAPLALPIQTVAASATGIEVVLNDEYVPPLLGIFDEEDVATPGPFGALATVSLEEPSPLPMEVLRSTAWPAPRPDIMLTGGYDTPNPAPFSATPKLPGQGSVGTSTIIPDLFDTQSSVGLVGPTSAPSTISRPSDNLIRPKPFGIDNLSSMVRTQPGEPPLAGNQVVPVPVPASPGPTAVVATPVPSIIQGIPYNLAEFTGCGCEPRVGPACGCSARMPHGCACGHQVPLCCQSFSNCCQTPVCSYRVIECSSCCSGEGHWRPFSKLKNWFRGGQKSCGSCFEDCSFDGCSSNKPLFGRFRGLFHKSRGDDCSFVEPCEMGCIR